MPRIVLKDIETERVQSVADLEATIGRDPSSAIIVDGPKSKVVSGRHARIFFQDNAWWIEDTSRNGTVLDDERLQAGQRHAVRVGQVVGLGESGPRLRVVTLDTRKIAETVVEVPNVEPPPAPKATTAPRQAAPRVQNPPPPVEEPDYPDNTTSIRRSDAIRAGVRFEEPTEPMSPAPDWLVQVVLRGTNSNQRYEATALVVKIGRAPECQVQVPAELGASVSRLHAEIAIQDGGVVVRDVGSRNGTFVNGRRIDGPHQTAKGDSIMLGSGGPTFTVEDLHIVKGQAKEAPSGGGGGRGGGEPTPPQAKPVAGNRMPEPNTEPAPGADSARRSFSGVGRTAFFKDMLEEVSQQSARRVRVMVWASVATAVIIAVGLIALTQMRVTASEELMAAERQQSGVRADSARLAATDDAGRLRASFDSARTSNASRTVLDSLRDALADAARRTGALEQALVRARESLGAQLALGDSAQRHAEKETARLSAEVSQASGAEGSGAALDSLRRRLKAAEERAEELASRVRVVRGSNLAQVAQLNQGAVGLLVSFAGERVVSGSGFAITPSGYFVTNRQVVTDESGKPRDTIYVTMADQRFNSANRVQSVALGPRDLDIAVVKIPEYRGPYVKKIDWSSSGAYQGEAAALIGFPYGIDLASGDTSASAVRTTMSAGTFSKVSPDRIQFDGFSVGASSGSPIFNASGAVVAIHRAGLSAGPGFGYSVPVSRVVSLLPTDARTELGIR